MSADTNEFPESLSGRNSGVLPVRFLQSRFAPILTHGALLLLSISLWMLLWFVPFWLMLVPGVLLAHRIGILLVPAAVSHKRTPAPTELFDLLVSSPYIGRICSDASNAIT